LWLKSTDPTKLRPGQPLVTVEGDPAIVSCVKMAEADDAIIVRLLEVRGKPAQTTLRWRLPDGRKLAKAFRADCIERPGSPIATADGTITVSLRPNEIATVGLTLEKP
jgi:alpha-mannosidase